MITPPSIVLSSGYRNGRAIEKDFEINYITVPSGLNAQSLHFLVQ
jgi:hypothetical protein